MLGTARLLLSVTGLVAIYLDPTEPTHFAGVAYGLLAAFVAYSAALLIVVRATRVGPRFPWAVHGADIAWASFISLFTSGPNSAFFVFFVFVILAAAFRWRMFETACTTLSLVAVLLAQAWLPGVDRRQFWLAGALDVHRLIVRAVYLLIVGFFAGYLGDKEKQAAIESAFIHGVVRDVRTGMSFRQAVAMVLSRLVAMFGARRGLIVLEDAESGRASLLDLSAGGNGALLASSVDADGRESPWRELSPREAARYFFPLPGTVMRIPGNGSRPTPVGLDDAGRLVPAPRVQVPDGIVDAPGCSILVGEVFHADQWRARTILVRDGGSRLRQEHALRFLQRVLENVGPIVHNVFLIGRVRSAATALERGRVAREIHDSSLQGLAAAQLQVQALEQRAAVFPDLAWELSRVREVLQEEALNLRDLMNRLRPIDIGPRELPDAIADVAERFQRETGITVEFMTDESDIDLPAGSCREMVRIVQEALTNVRKHSAAHSVVIRLERVNERWALAVEDDGKGFDFAGEMTIDALDDSCKGPRVIKERVRSLGGSLTLISTPGRGSQLHVLIPARPAIEYA